MKSKYIGKWNIEIRFGKEGIEPIKTTCEFLGKGNDNSKASNMEFGPPDGVTAQELYELMNNPENKASIVLMNKCHAKTARSAD